MAAALIAIYKSKVGTCYKHQDGRYLGKFIEMSSRVRDSSAGSAGQSRAPIYVFEKETIEDNYPSDKVIATSCIETNGARRSRKSIKKVRRIRKSIKKLRRNR
jgi:hypothetical protein